MSRASPTQTPKPAVSGLFYAQKDHMSNLHPIFERALAPFAPPALTDSERAEIDAAMDQDKQPLPGQPLTDAREQRRQNNALRMQMNDQTGYYK